MTKTRRQSKAQAALAAEQSSPMRESSPATGSQSTAMVISMPDDLDSETLSSILPDASLESPSPEAILALYRLVLAQASDVDATQRELEEAKAEVERKDVELDQALQDKETTTKELETTLENAQNELKQVKQEKDEIAAARAALQTQLASLSTSESASHTEVETLKHRIEDTEREKRDLIGVVSRLKEDSAQRDEEIQTLRSNLKQARQEHQALEGQLRELRSTETSIKFKTDSLTQQLQLAKDEAERTSTDLAVKSEEFAKYRRSKHAELAQLQASHDSLAQTHAATESSLKALQSSHTSQSHQLTQGLARIQDLNGQLAEQEATYSSEAAGLKRLIEMMEEREAQAKSIVEGIEKEWATVGERAERREAVLREEIDAQRHRVEVAEKRVADLQKVLDRMDKGEFPVPGSVPGTPARGPATPMRNGTPDFLTQGMMGLSPTVAMASRVQRGGKTFTEVYADYVKLQEEFAKKSMEYDHMDRTLSAVLAQIEERAPILAQQRQEYERLQSEASLLASQLAQALAERDAHAHSAQENGQKLTKSLRENQLLEQQLNDLGRQIQTLLKELGRRQDPSIPSDQELEDDQSSKPAENIEAVITNNLVLFRSIPALQEQNQKLLKIVRELGAKMESEEKDYRETLEREQDEAVREAHEAIKILQEQLENLKRSSELTIQAYMKERDALRSTLQRERSAPKGVNGINGHDARASEKGTPDDLVEIQSQFEAYKTEMGVDSVTLREEVLVAQREAGQLSTALAKANAKIEYLNDRHRMLQEQTTMQNRELDNLSKRNQELYDQYTRIDIECNRVSEDLLSARSTAEQLRNECANLRAEKKIWESVQGRLVEDNKTLTVERSQLSDLMANLQRMHGDLERSNENDRRRLEGQIQMLEGQTQDLRTQLTQERDSVRHISLQKDIELKELRIRIDKSTQEYAKTRESLVIAETSKKHLEEQVEQLTRQLHGNEEKLAVYERRASSSNSVAQRTEQTDLNGEQQLEAEVAELRSALKVAEVDLASARSHVQQFQEISQANEAALASLNATYDEYKTSTEAQIATRESDCNSLQEKLKSIQEELTQLQEKNSGLQHTLESERAAWAADKKTLEDAIVDMTTSEKSSENDRVSREHEVRQQEERAKAAEERYSREVLAHAESIKTVEELRQQLSKSMASARGNLAASETAQAKLVTSEASWKQQKEALDKEVADLNTRCKDLAAQNNLLHQHLESVSSQAARIRQAADSSSSLATGESDSTDDVDTKLSELRSVVAYLRKEKEIVDLQLDLSKQENIRLKTQIEHLTQSLEETRKTLSEERERAVETAGNEAQHAELVERINQLTILRESNATLRADCEAHAKRARMLDEKLRQLSTELDPLKEQLRVTRAELEARNQQVQRLEEESRRWQERNTQLLSKYDRIDPAEVQSLKEQIEQLNSVKAELEKGATEREQGHSSRIAHLETQLEKAKEIGRRNNEIAKTRFEANRVEQQKLNANIEELRRQVQEITAERDLLKTQSTSTSEAASREQDLTRQLEALRQEKEQLEKSLATERATKAAAPSTDNEQAKLIANLTKERDDLLAQQAVLTIQAAAASSDGTTHQWEAEKSDLIKSRDEALAQVQTANQQAVQITDSLKQMRHANSTFQSKIADLTKARMQDNERAKTEQQAAVAAAVEKVKGELQSAPVATGDIARKHAEDLRALEDRLTKKHQEELKAAMEQATANGAANGDQKAIIEAAVLARVKEQLNAAVERGRMETAAKAKLKDSQLVKTQNRLKDAEAQIQQWRAAGLIPADASTTGGPATAPPAVTQKAAPAAHAKPGATVGRPTPPVRTTSVPGSSSLPQRPGTAPTAHPHGAGRGVRGGAPRGGGPRLAAAAGLSIRGAAPAGGESQTAGSSTSAVKRAREEGETSTDDSLAKRLKPADGPGTSKPVPIRRDRVPPPS